MTWDWVKQNALTVVNLLGSVASIVGFAILILSIASADSNLPPVPPPLPYEVLLPK